MAEEQPPHTEESEPDSEPGVAVEDAATVRRPLCRSSTDRLIAGVAGGIGAYFGIDAVIVRIAFIVLTFLGGAGPFLYLIGWLALPKQDSRSVIAKALGGDSPHRLRSLAAVALIGFGLLVTANLSGALFDAFLDVWSMAPYLALILIVAGVALVLWPGPSGRHRSAPARPSGPQAPRSSTPPSSSPYASPVAPSPSPSPYESPVAPSPSPSPYASPVAPSPSPSPYASPAPPSPSPYESPAPPSPTVAGPEWPDVSPTGSPYPSGAPAPAPAPKRRRGRSMIGSLTVATLLAYTGAAMTLGRLDAIEVDISVFFAVALAVTGAGLLASAFAVAARGLILLGVALCVPVLLLAGSDVRWGTGAGETRVSVADLSELNDEYRHGIGQLIVDLRDLDPERTDHSVDLSLGIGELRVYVPDSVATTAEIAVGAGNSEVRGAGILWEAADGLGISRTTTVPPSGETTGVLRLEMDVGIGEAEVVTVPGSNPGSGSQ